jgi:hypothetical protein
VAPHRRRGAPAHFLSLLASPLSPLLALAAVNFATGQPWNGALIGAMMALSALLALSRNTVRTAPLIVLACLAAARCLEHWLVRRLARAIGKPAANSENDASCSQDSTASDTTSVAPAGLRARTTMICRRSDHTALLAAAKPMSTSAISDLQAALTAHRPARPTRPFGLLVPSPTRPRAARGY